MDLNGQEIEMKLDKLIEMVSSIKTKVDENSVKLELVQKSIVPHDQHFNQVYILVKLI